MNDDQRDWVPVPLRLVAGGGLAYHGGVKLFSRRGHENIVSMAEQMGLPLPEAAGWGIGALELGAGLALVTGVRVRPTAAIVVGEVVINLLSALRRGGFPQPLPGGDPLPGVERSYFYGACSVALLLSGAGRCSWDRRRARGAS